MKRLLIQTQLSNYTSDGKFVLEADSGWQMCINRAREMLKLVPDLHIDIMGPWRDEDDMDGMGQLITHPYKVNEDLWTKHGESGDKRLGYVPYYVTPHALTTRYEFDMYDLNRRLNLEKHADDPSLKYDVVYVNDPMHLRNLKAMFFIKGGYQPKFVVHSHFIDDPSAPKFPKEASLWLGQCEAAIRADYNFWQCESAMNVFFKEFGEFFNQDVLKYVREKSMPWDDGFSLEETKTFDTGKMRFTPEEFKQKVGDKIIVFFPNRISPSSGDYTNGCKFMFEMLPELRKNRQDFVVIAGNPNLKYTNAELEEKCSPNGYVSIVPDTLRRDEFKFVANNSHIAVGLYDKDSYGGTAARECIELGCLPLWIDKYEYSTISRASSNYPYVGKPDFTDLTKMLSVLIEHCKIYGRNSPWGAPLRRVVKHRCSYEMTTPEAIRKMGLL